MDLLRFFLQGGSLLSTALQLASLLLREALHPVGAPAPPPAPARPPRWALLWLAQGLCLPLLCGLLPSGLLLPPQSAGYVVLLALAHTALQLLLTDFFDLADHVLLGPRSAGTAFYNGAPGQRSRRMAIAILVAYLAYFTASRTGTPTRWGLFACTAVAAATPLLPAFASAMLIEGGLTDPQMRARLWQWFWAS